MGSNNPNASLKISKNAKMTTLARRNATPRSEEHTSELQSHRDLHSFPTRRSSDLPELTFIIDGVEQPKRKPKDKQKRKDDYSGKKKRHTRKQVITGTRSGLIVDQSPSVGGR